MPENGNLAATVKLLDNVAGRDAPNQLTLASRIRISVGLVNALVNRAVRKGLIKIKEASARLYAYYLTSKGLAEKSRLVAEYLDYSFSFFRTARQEYNEVFARCEAIGRRHIILCGAGELAEVATLEAHGRNVELVAVLDFATNHVRIAGLPVVRDLGAIESDDVVVITDGRKPQITYDRLAATLESKRILTSTFLRISRSSEAEEGAEA